MFLSTIPSEQDGHPGIAASAASMMLYTGRNAALCECTHRKCLPRSTKIPIDKRKCVHSLRNASHPANMRMFGITSIEIDPNFHVHFDELPLDIGRISCARTVHVISTRRVGKFDFARIHAALRMISEKKPRGVRQRLGRSIWKVIYSTVKRWQRENCRAVTSADDVLLV